jgi:hypothetical protein
MFHQLALMNWNGLSNNDNDNNVDNAGTQHLHPQRRQRQVWLNGQPTLVMMTT